MESCCLRESSQSLVGTVAEVDEAREDRDVKQQQHQVPLVEVGVKQEQAEAAVVEPNSSLSSSRG